MSLHLANLSSRIRKDELERVFRGFGRCTVQLKDGYGFVVYDFHEDAEKALRTLKGRKICGQSVYLSWSNKQPKPAQKFARVARPHGVSYGRNADRGGNLRGRKFSRSRGDYSVGDKHLLDKGQERHQSVDDYRANVNIDESVMHTDPMEGVFEESGHVEVEHNQNDNGRWGEQVEHHHNDSDFDGQMGYDRYNPDYVDERGKDHENQDSGRVAGSQSAGMSPDKKRRIHSDNKRGKQTCFNCGSPGHMMRDCPLKEALLETNTFHSENRHEANTNSEVRREDSRYGRRLQSTSKNSRSMRRSDTERKQSHSGKIELNGRSPVETESKRDKREDINYRKRRKRYHQIVEAHDDKKSRHVALSHLHSGCISPELDTLSGPKKLSVGTSFHSRSASPIPRSLSASSRSNSRGHSPRNLRSKSMSRSRSPSSFVSIVPSSPNKALNLNGFSEAAASPSSNVNKGQRIEPEVMEDKLLIANRADQSLSSYADHASSYQLIEVPLDSKQQKDKSQTSASTKVTEMSLYDFVEDDQIIQNKEAVPNERQGLEPETVQKSTPPQTDVNLLSEDISSSGKVLGDMKTDQLHENGRSNSTTPQLYCEVETPSSLLENDDKGAADVNVAAQKPRTEEITSATEMTNQLEPASSKVLAGSHLSISAEELSRVLKHYGLKHSEDNEHHRDVGDYFGSSRLWPWEMIYYRRLKKGPISVENYARRVAQNKAFNITDKYIRSSSGWGELIEERDKKELNLY